MGQIRIKKLGVLDFSDYVDSLKLTPPQYSSTSSVISGFEKRRSHNI